MRSEKKTEMEAPKIEPLPGFIEARFVKCGRSNCCCITGSGHGPYYYWVYRKGKRRFKKYVRKRDLAQIIAGMNERRKQIKEAADMNRESKTHWQQLKARLKELDTRREEILRLMEV